MVDLPADQRGAEAGPGPELGSFDPGDSGLDPDTAYLRSALDLDTAHLKSALEQARKDEGGTWLTGMMIISPVSLLILLSVFFGDLQMKLWAAVFAVGFGVQLMRWKRAELEVKRLEGLLEATTGELPEAPTGKTPAPEREA